MDHCHVQTRISVRIGILFIVMSRHNRFSPFGFGRQRVPVDGLEQIDTVLSRAIAAGFREIGLRIGKIADQLSV